MTRLPKRALRYSVRTRDTRRAAASSVTSRRRFGSRSAGRGLLAVALVAVGVAACKPIPVERHRYTYGASDMNSVVLPPLELRYDGRSVDARSSRLSGGIVLKSDTVTVDAWLEALGQAVADEAQRSAITRQALERLLLQ